MAAKMSYNDSPELKRQYYEMMANRWLGDANEAEERGAVKTAEKCMKKAQYWLDKLNEIEGLS